MYEEPNGYYDPHKVKIWSAELLNRADGDLPKLIELLSELSRREVWLFWGEFINLTYSFDKTPPAPSLFDRFGDPRDISNQIHPFMVSTCFSQDGEGSLYPDAAITDWAWAIIERAGKSQEKLKEILGTLSKGEIYRFDNEYESASGVLRDDPFMEFMTYGSEDSVEDVSHWVTGQGKEFYYSVWNNPETIPYSFSDVRRKNRDDDLWCWRTAWSVYEEKFGEELDSFEP